MQAENVGKPATCFGTSVLRHRISNFKHRKTSNSDHSLNHCQSIQASIDSSRMKDLDCCMRVCEDTCCKVAGFSK